VDPGPDPEDPTNDPEDPISDPGVDPGTGSGDTDEPSQPSSPPGDGEGSEFLGCIGFEELALGTIYHPPSLSDPVGDEFTVSSSGGSLSFLVSLVGSLEATSMGMYGDNYQVTVEDGGKAGVSGHELHIENTWLRFRPAVVLSEGLELHFGIWGGEDKYHEGIGDLLNLNLNGVWAGPVETLIELDGKMVGGVLISVSEGEDVNEHGTLKLQGRIEHFTIGGSELWLDEICLLGGEELPKPPEDPNPSQPLPEDCIEFNELTLGQTWEWPTRGPLPPNRVTLGRFKVEGEQGFMKAEVVMPTHIDRLVKWTSDSADGGVRRTIVEGIEPPLEHTDDPGVERLPRSVRVETGGMFGNKAGSYGNELHVVGQSLLFLFDQPFPAPGIMLNLGIHGGPDKYAPHHGDWITLYVNKTMSNGGSGLMFQSLKQLDGLTLPGVELEVPLDSNGDDLGQLIIKGDVYQFEIVAEPMTGYASEFWVDRICLWHGNDPSEPPSVLPPPLPPADPPEDPQMPSSPICELVVYSGHDDGIFPSGGDPDPLSSDWTFPNAMVQQSVFLMELTTLGLNSDWVTFERANGWDARVGKGDLFIGESAPYGGGAYTSPAFGTAGGLAAGNARGSVDYYGVDNRLTFTLFENGHDVSTDEPCIGEMDGSNDTDRGINTTPEGIHFIEVLPSESSEGGLEILLEYPVPAIGMYVGGVEASKRPIMVEITLANGIVIQRPSDLIPGPLDVGGMQFLGYRTPDLALADCYIKAVRFVELYVAGDAAHLRDIFVIDDLIYVAAEERARLDSNALPGQLGAIYGGRVIYRGDSDRPIRDVSIKAQGQPGTMIQSDQDGSFAFESDSEEIFKLEATKEDWSEIRSGLDVADVVLARKHILFHERLASSLSMVAADVNADQSIDVADILDMKKVILAREDQFSLDAQGNPRSPWRFFNLSFASLKPEETFGQMLAHQYLFHDPLSSLSDRDRFVAVKLGDINGDWQPDTSSAQGLGATPSMGWGIPQGRAGGLQLGVVTEQPSGDLVLPLYLDYPEPLLGMQGDLSWNPEVLVLKSVHSSALAGLDAHRLASSATGRTRFIWDDATASGVNIDVSSPVLTFRFKRLKQGGSPLELGGIKIVGVKGEFEDRGARAIYLESINRTRRTFNGNIKLISHDDQGLAILVHTAGDFSYRLQSSTDLTGGLWKDLMLVESQETWQTISLPAEEMGAFLRMVPIQALND